MTYQEGIVGLPEQFKYKPEILNKEKLRAYKRVIVCGMGGSRLAADILNMVRPDLDIYIHSDFDLPGLSDEALAESLVIANSYSGDTAETVSGAKKALEKKLNLVVVAGGGELLDLASSHELPHIKIPRDDLPARLSVGRDVMALATVLNIDSEMFAPCATIDAMILEGQGRKIAGQLGSGVPLIYTSNRFNELGYIWKVILNETAKTPAFNNRFPEIDHNEIAGFERINPVGFHCLMLEDGLDARIQHRMDAMTALLHDKGIPVTTVPLEGGSMIYQIVSSMVVAHWAAAELAQRASIDPSATSLIDEFKKDVL